MMRLCTSMLGAFLVAAVPPNGPCQATAQVVLGLPDDDSPTANRLPATTEVRAAMRGIRQRVLDAHSLITHRRVPREAATAFKADILRLMESIKGEAQGSPPLKDITVLILIGSTEIGEPSSAESQLEGLSKIETALESYAQVFDDPDWQPLR